MARDLVIDVTLDDWVEFQIFTYKRLGLFAKTVRKNRLNTALILLIIFAFIAYTVKDGTSFFVSLLFLVVYLVISMIRAASQFESAQRNSVEAMAGLDNANRVLGKKLLKLAEDHIEVSDEYEITKYLANSFIYVLHDTNSIYLYRDKISAVIVPISSFQDDKEMQEFLTEVRDSRLVVQTD